MPPESPFAALPPPLADALAARGFTELTSVQEAVLDPALAGRALRISSKTGSGKTVAIGIVLARELVDAVLADKVPDTEVGPAGAQPLALVVAPTRELATQVARELTWFLEPIGATVSTVTGGTSVADERRALRNGATVIVGTPGRLRDHIEKRAIDASAVRAVVLDEADQMLDLGFREDLEAILGATPKDRHTHMVSATFPREVIALADRFQRDAVRIEGTVAGAANDDIAHVAHLVRPTERLAALVNLLLLSPGERTLVFVRTRADATTVAEKLADAGFAARALSGEMEQWERTKTLDAFRAGTVLTLVATDVAARGLDVPEVNRVIHADPPGSADALTHRSGRTGRAGRKGTAIVLCTPPQRELVSRLYSRARLRAAWRPVPTPADVLRGMDERLRAELIAASGSTEGNARFVALAHQLVAEVEPHHLVAELLRRIDGAGPRAMPITPIEGAPPEPRTEGRAPRAPLPVPARARSSGPTPTSWSSFRITWGTREGADARRLLAMVCRRGQIEGNQVGAIRIGDSSSTFQVASDVASDFAREAGKPDARDPRVRIEAYVAGPDDDAPPARAPRYAGAIQRPTAGASPRFPAKDGPSAAPSPRYAGKSPRTDAGPPNRYAGKDARPSSGAPPRFAGKESRPTGGPPPRFAGKDPRPSSSAPPRFAGKESRPTGGPPPRFAGKDARPGPGARYAGKDARTGPGARYAGKDSRSNAGPPARFAGKDRRPVEPPPKPHRKGVRIVTAGEAPPKRS